MHGVAILSRVPFLSIDRRGFCDKGDARHIAVVLDAPGGPIEVHNLYVPAGGDEPDPASNEKLAHKLAFLRELTAWIGTTPAAAASIIMRGYCNIHPPAGRGRLVAQEASRRRQPHAGGDGGAGSHPRGRRLDRRHAPLRAGAGEALHVVELPPPPSWAAADKGRRLDHVWASAHLDRRLAGMEVLRAARGWERPSDHAPVVVRLDG